MDQGWIIGIGDRRVRCGCAFSAES
jgi:hypothetical protein